MAAPKHVQHIAGALIAVALLGWCVNVAMHAAAAGTALSSAGAHPHALSTFAVDGDLDARPNATVVGWAARTLGAVCPPPGEAGHPDAWTRRAGVGRMLLSARLPQAVRMRPAVGNGYLATQVLSDAVFVSGVYNGPAVGVSRVSHRAQLPSTLVWKFGRRPQAVSHALDTHHGVFHQLTCEEIEPGTVVWIEQRWLAHRERRSLQVLQVDAAVATTGPRKRVSVPVAQTVPLKSKDFSFSGVQYVELGMRGSAAGADIYEQLPGDGAGHAPVALHQASTQIPEIPEKNGGRLLGVAIVTHEAPEAIDVPADGGVYSARYMTTIRTSLGGDHRNGKYQQQAVDDFVAALSSGPTLLAQHARAWARLYQSADILVEQSDSALDRDPDHAREPWDAKGSVDMLYRPPLPSVIKSTLYYILSSLRSDWPWSTSPGGLSRSDYNGHVFWDTEIWMLPPLQLLHPALARSALQYRANHVQGASVKARSHGYRGLMFPWESALMGIETCPLRAETGLLEHHISGDIAYALLQHWYLTRDVAWMRETAFPVLVGISEFWASRATLRTRKAPSLSPVMGDSEPARMYDIDVVIPPDEFAIGVNNSVYTNYIAALCIRETVTLARTTMDGQNLVDSDTMDAWLEVAGGLVLPYDDALGVHLEHETYDGTRKTKESTKGTIKQADVALLGYPLMMDGLTPEQRRADLDYYAERTFRGGPAMSFSMYAIGYLEPPANLDKAVASFHEAYRNVKGPFHVWTEGRGGQGASNFITGAGGFLQAVLNGFLGVRVTEHTMFLAPRLMQDTTRLSVIGLYYRGHRFDVTVLEESIQFFARRDPDTPGPRARQKIGVYRGDRLMGVPTDDAVAFEYAAGFDAKGRRPVVSLREVQ